MDKLFIKSEDLLKDSFKLAWNVYESGIEPNYIIGVWRGGAPIGISYYSGIDNKIEKVQVYGLNYVIRKLESHDRLLIVDDVHDTGHSIEQVINDIKTACKKIHLKLKWQHHILNLRKI